MARILVTHTSHFLRGPDDIVYNTNTLLARPFWSKYQSVFDVVGVAARVRRVDRIPGDASRADGDGVEFCDLPDFTGPRQYVFARRQMRARVREFVERYEAYCLRVPSVVGTHVWRELLRRNRPYGLEVVGDPWDSLAPGGVKSLLRPWARRAAARELRTQCWHAPAVWYVTREALQRRYPPSPSAFHEGFSDIELPDSAVVDQPRETAARPFRLVCVGTLAVLYKAQDILIQAVARTGRSDLHLTLVGDGRARPQLEELASSLGIRDQVTFAGQVSAGDGVRNALDNADLFVLASRQEGLPRAMVEAMARALPCIGSTVGGIPELLAPEDLVPPEDVDALAAKIAEFMDDSRRYALASERNLLTSREYRASALKARRTAFYQELLRLSRQTTA